MRRVSNKCETIKRKIFECRLICSKDIQILVTGSGDMVCRVELVDALWYFGVVVGGNGLMTSTAEKNLDLIDKISSVGS